MPLTQANHEVTISTALADDILLFERMNGAEQLGRPFEYHVQLVSAHPDVKIADVLGKPMAVKVALPGGGARVFHGIVTRFASSGWNGRFARYEATLRPWLWLLTRSSNCRIFQAKSVVDIVKLVCTGGPYGGNVNVDVSALTGTYPELDFCVQYRETDFAFVSRLLEGAGIYYFFRHEVARHTMVLADAYGAHATAPNYATIRFAGEEGRGIVDEEAVHQWLAAGEIQSGRYVLDDFDFVQAMASTSGALLVNSAIAAPFAQPDYEMYDYPGGYVAAGHGTGLARARMESLHGQGEEITGQTNARGVAPGVLFALAEHPRDDQNRTVLVTGASYDITDAPYASSSDGAVFDFRCSFTAVGKEYSYRPLPVTPRPVVRGPQTAMVVGKAGEEIWTDQHGRIKVQFHWDRVGADDENSSCWVRVQQAWAGKGWGTVFLPRIGMEVVVTFLEGDPDRPLVTGCVYNGDAPPPYALPGNQTQSGIKTNVSKGGGGFNEMRFEDSKDAEEIFVQAERNHTRIVKNDDVLKVGFEKADKGDQTITIKNDQGTDVGHDQVNKIGNDRSMEVGHDQTCKIGNDRSSEIGNDDKLTVKHDRTVAVTGNHVETVEGKQTVTITGDQGITGKAKIEITATTSIELKVGGSSIKIEPARITIKSTAVEVVADGNASVNANGMLELKAGGVASLAGSLVKVN